MIKWAPLLLLSGCIGTKMVDPPATPVAIAPKSLYEDPPRQSSKGRLVLDTVGTRASAFDIVQSKKADDPDAHQLVFLCETPCAVNLSYGPHRIAFVSPQDYVGQENVTIAAQPLVMREQLGYVKTRKVPWYAGIGAATLGGFAMLFGVGFAAQGDGPMRDPQTLKDTRTAGVGLIIGGGAMLGLAWLLLHLGRTEIQPSAAAIFPEP